MELDSKSEDGNSGYESYSSSTVSSTSSSSSTCSTSSTSSAFTSLSGALNDVTTDSIHSNSTLLRATRSWAYYLDGRRTYQYRPRCHDRSSSQPNNGHSQCPHWPSDELTDQKAKNALTMRMASTTAMTAPFSIPHHWITSLETLSQDLL